MAFLRRDEESNRRSLVVSSALQEPFRQALLWTTPNDVAHHRGFAISLTAASNVGYTNAVPTPRSDMPTVLCSGESFW